jgi:hypothetical protein
MEVKQRWSVIEWVMPQQKIINIIIYIPLKLYPRKGSKNILDIPPKFDYLELLRAFRRHVKPLVPAAVVNTHQPDSGERER